MVPASARGRVVLAVLVVAVTALLTMGAGPGGAADPAADAPTELGRCTDITEPGVYEIDEEFAAGGFAPSQQCLRITADDVVIAGGGNDLDGLGASNTTGVHVVGADNVTVRNLRVADWQRGIHFDNASNAEVRNVTATSNVYGVVVENSTATAGDGANVSNNLVGVRFDGDTSSRLGNAVAASNRIGGVHEEIAIRGHGIEWTYGPPVDRDGDGRYEDLTGDGGRTVSDSLALVLVVTADALGVTDLSDDQEAALDFDGNGDLGPGDVLAF